MTGLTLHLPSDGSKIRAPYFWWEWDEKKDEKKVPLEAII